MRSTKLSNRDTGCLMVRCVSLTRIILSMALGAADYNNEKQAGEGVKRAIDEGVIKREDIFITSKLWSNFVSTSICTLSGCKR